MTASDLLCCPYCKMEATLIEWGVVKDANSQGYLSTLLQNKYRLACCRYTCPNCNNVATGYQLVSYSKRLSGTQTKDAV